MGKHRAVEMGLEGAVVDLAPGVGTAEAALISIAISLKRIADALNTTDKYGMTGSASLAQAIVDGLRGR